MALPRKGSRRIVVEGVAYRWRGSYESLAVQHEDAGGAMLFVPLGRTWIAPPPMPHEVANLIRAALAQGWQPTSPGPAFRLPQPPLPTLSVPVPEHQTTSEATWLAATDPLWLLAQLQADQNERSTLLATVAACRLIWDHLPGVCREWVALVEQVVAENGDPAAINDGNIFEPVREGFDERLTTITAPALRSRVALVSRLVSVDWALSNPAESQAEEGALLADIVREMFGNPFQPEPVLRRSALTRTIRAIAETIFAEQTFADLPILADALEEAECADAAILAHLRSPGPHARGCWALDLVLGYE